MRDLTCLEVADSAPGFALDILEPETRSRVAAHLLRCEACRRSVTDMQESAAQLLDTVDSRAETFRWDDVDWASEDFAPVVRPARRRFRMVVCAAAAAVLFVGTTLGPEITQAARPAEQPSVSAVLMAGDRAVGSVRFYADRTATVDLQVDHLPAVGNLAIVVNASDGSARQIGRFQVSHGRAAWVGHYPAGAARPTGVVLLDSTLHQVAAAALS